MKVPRVSRRSLSMAAICLLLLATVIPSSWLAYYRWRYRTFAWWRPPPAIHYCDRNYDRGVTLDGWPTGWRYPKVMEVEPGGWPVYAQTPLDDEYKSLPVSTCTLVLILREKDNSLTQYLAGGAP